MSTFDDWLDRAGQNTQRHMLHATELGDKGEALLDQGRLDALIKIKAKRKEMVCANCDHFQPLTNCSYFGAGVFVSPDFYCKSFTMKGEE